MSRLLVIVGAIALVGGGLYLLRLSGDGPRLYKGDVLEERSCPACGGRGQGCGVCGGTGKVDAVKPGPNRPVQIFLDVCDQHERHPGTKEHPVEWVWIPGTLPTEPKPGYLRDVR